MARQTTIKRVLFYLTALMIVLLPTQIENPSMTYFAMLFVFGLATVMSFIGCSKEDFKKITGIDIFTEE